MQLPNIPKIAPRWSKRAGMAIFALVLIAGFVYALAPKPVPVDMVAIDRGDLVVTVDEEAKTRIKDVYVVSAPMMGRVLRSDLEVGDRVTKDETVVARLMPNPPPFFDLRSARELEAQIKAAEAAVTLAQTKIRQARSELEFALQELKRSSALAKKNVVTARRLEQDQVRVRTRTAAVAEAEANLDLRRQELARARVRRTRPDDPSTQGHGDTCCVRVTSPVSGRVLKLHRESEQVVAQGTPLVDVGDPGSLEIVVELLSEEAVRIREGAGARIEAWGGSPLDARVERIEPAGFTKVSALGIEEQRVRVILAFEAAKGKHTLEGLGHDYRVFVRITEHEEKDALLVPLGALFRNKGSWAVFRFEDARAALTQVRISYRNKTHAVIASGLEEGQLVVLHPSDRVAGGTPIVSRPAP